MWDVIIVGAGSAGMAAAIYAARFNLKTLMIGQEVGGLLNESHNVENYPGYVSIPGLDLMMKFKEHVDSLSVPTKNEIVSDVKIENPDSPKQRKFIVTTKNQEGSETNHEGRTLIIATGAKHRHLNAPGEDKLAGKGVSYCATCDAAFYKGVPVAIVGGGDSAALAGSLVKKFASHVYVIVRKEKMRAEPINLKRLEDADNVTIVYNTEVVEILGENQVDAIKLSKPFEGSDKINVEGVFIEIGQIINSELAEKMGVKLNERKEIIINDKSETNLQGVYAAGDVGDRAYKQALTGASEGAVAAFGAYALIQSIDEGEEVELGY